MRRGSSSRIYIVVLTAGACLLALGLNGWRSWQTREAALAGDRIETANLARSLAQHVQDNLETANAVIYGLRERIEVATPQTINRAAFYQLMANYVRQLPMLAGLFVYDAQGNWVVTSRSPYPSQALNNADRTYFRYHRSNPDRTGQVGEPVRSKSDGAWILPVSIRVDDAQGQFEGVVLATLSIPQIQHFFQTFNPGHGGAIGLITADGKLVARNPPDDTLVGSDVSHGAIFQHLKAGTASEAFTYTSLVDHEKRYGTLDRVRGYPLVVIVSHSLAFILQPWQLETLEYLTVITLGIGALLMLAVRGSRQIKRGEDAEHRYRLLADYSTDAIICTTLAGKPTYVSPAFAVMTGWTESETLGASWADLVETDDRAAFLSAMVEAGDVTGAIAVSFRQLCKHREPVWVEARLRLLPANQAADPQFIANIRDISRRKAAEQEAERLNQELQAIARQDALTALPNRRCFDEVLQAEWKRARRQESQLSLIMIDVDHFKLYNDRYGHPQGDRCLRIVADTIAKIARRPADLPARYGGEEMAIILPHTAPEGAMLLAEGVCAAVEAAMIDHESNEPWRHVTVSVGVATIQPERTDERDAAFLVSRADEALYIAKKSGRNRVRQYGGESPARSP